MHQMFRTSWLSKLLSNYTRRAPPVEPRDSCTVITILLVVGYDSSMYHEVESSRGTPRSMTYNLRPCGWYMNVLLHYRFRCLSSTQLSIQFSIQLPIQLPIFSSQFISSLSSSQLSIGLSVQLSSISSFSHLTSIVVQFCHQSSRSENGSFSIHQFATVAAPPCISFISYFYPSLSTPPSLLSVVPLQIRTHIRIVLRVWLSFRLCSLQRGTDFYLRYRHTNVLTTLSSRP